MLAPFGIRPKGTLAQRMLPLAQALAERGWHCTIVAPAYTWPADAGRVETIEHVRVEHVRLPVLPGPGHAVETSLRMLRAVLGARPDVVHVFKPKGYSGLAALALHLLYPHTACVQDTDDWEGWGGWNDLLPYPAPMKHVFAWQERTLPQLADVVTVASRTLETQVWGFGVEPSRVVYLPNGVAHERRLLPPAAVARARLGVPDEPIVLLYTRFWEYPLRDIVELLVMLRARRPDARLLVIGDGEQGEAAALGEVAARAGVAQKLDARGWSDQATIEAAIAAADVAVMPFADTLMNRAKCSVKLLELLHAGVPLVASRVGQASEYVQDGQTGLLVDPGGVALARGVIELLADEPRRRALGDAAASDVANRWSWQRLAALAEEAYAAAISSSR